MPSAFGGQERPSDPLKLKIQKVVSFHLGDKNSIQVQTASALNCLHVSALPSIVFAHPSYSQLELAMPQSLISYYRILYFSLSVDAPQWEDCFHSVCEVLGSVPKTVEFGP